MESLNKTAATEKGNSKILAVVKIFRHLSNGSSYFTCKVVLYDSNFNIIDIVKIPYTYGYESQPNYTTKLIIDEKYNTNEVIYNFVDLGYKAKKRVINYIEG